MAGDVKLTASGGVADGGIGAPVDNPIGQPTSTQPTPTHPTSAHPTSAQPTSTQPALSGLVGQALVRAVDDLSRSGGAEPVRVLDCGGGSGSLAVPLAGHGCRVTVVDTSIDALSILERRAGEAGVAERVLAVQGDIESLAAVVADASMDVVLLHGVLEPGPSAASLFAAAAAAVRPGGLLSVLAGNPAAIVLARALSGELEAALVELEATSEPLSLPGLGRLAHELGLDVELAQGVEAFSSTVPGHVLASRPRAADALERLDRLAAVRAPYRDIAAHLHLLARRRPSAGPNPAVEA